MEKIKIILADDHTIVLDGLKAVLNSKENIEVVAQMEEGKSVLKYLESNVVDVAILDINMPVMDGITCAKLNKKHHPSVKVLILTMYPQRTFVEEFLKIGIDGCLLKNNSGQELETAIRRVMNGKNYFDMIKKFKSPDEEVTQYKLSARELDIIKLLTEGLTSYEIADKLFISEHTVKTHRKNILRKTKVGSTAKLVSYALEHKLV